MTSSVWTLRKLLKCFCLSCLCSKLTFLAVRTFLDTVKITQNMLTRVEKKKRKQRMVKSSWSPVLKWCPDLPQFKIWPPIWTSTSIPRLWPLCFKTLQLVKEPCSEKTLRKFCFQELISKKIKPKEPSSSKIWWKQELITFKKVKARCVLPTRPELPQKCNWARTQTHALNRWSHHQQASWLEVLPPVLVSRVLLRIRTLFQLK